MCALQCTAPWSCPCCTAVVTYCIPAGTSRLHSPSAADESQVKAVSETDWTGRPRLARPWFVSSSRRRSLVTCARALTAQQEPVGYVFLVYGRLWRTSIGQVKCLHRTPCWSLLAVSVICIPSPNRRNNLSAGITCTPPGCGSRSRGRFRVISAKQALSDRKTSYSCSPSWGRILF